MQFKSGLSPKVAVAVLRVLLAALFSLLTAGACGYALVMVFFLKAPVLTALGLTAVFFGLPAILLHAGIRYLEKRERALRKKYD